MRTKYYICGQRSLPTSRLQTLAEQVISKLPPIIRKKELEKTEGVCKFVPPPDQLRVKYIGKFKVD